MRIGLIADTHGLLRPEALAFLAGCDHLLHAGDIGDPAILDALAALAPLTAVRGNNDRGAWACLLPPTACLALAGLPLCLHHDRNDLADLPPGTRVLVTGHSHRPQLRDDGGLLHINPGSAGRRRFSLPVAAGELRVTDATLEARVVRLDGTAPETLLAAIVPRVAD